jgi:hypothetical protein
MKTVREYFAAPSSLTNPDDLRIYRFLSESGWITPPEQEQLSFNLKETPLAKWVHREAAARARRVKQRKSG